MGTDSITVYEIKKKKSEPSKSEFKMLLNILRVAAVNHPTSLPHT